MSTYFFLCTDLTIQVRIERYVLASMAQMKINHIGPRLASAAAPYLVMSVTNGHEAVLVVIAPTNYPA